MLLIERAVKKKRYIKKKTNLNRQTETKKDGRMEMQSDKGSDKKIAKVQRNQENRLQPGMMRGAMGPRLIVCRCG